MPTQAKRRSVRNHGQKSSRKKALRAARRLGATLTRFGRGESEAEAVLELSWKGQSIRRVSDTHPALAANLAQLARYLQARVRAAERGLEDVFGDGAGAATRQSTPFRGPIDSSHAKRKIARSLGRMGVNTETLQVHTRHNQVFVQFSLPSGQRFRRWAIRRAKSRGNLDALAHWFEELAEQLEAAPSPTPLEQVFAGYLVAKET